VLAHILAKCGQILSGKWSLMVTKGLFYFIFVRASWYGTGIGHKWRRFGGFLGKDNRAC